MAHFISYIKGSRGEASRLGTKTSGMKAEADGWDIGGSIRMWVGDDGEDYISFRVTRGSNNYGRGICLGTYKLVKGEIQKVE